MVSFLCSPPRSSEQALLFFPGSLFQKGKFGTSCRVPGWYSFYKTFGEDSRFGINEDFVFKLNFSPAAGCMSAERLLYSNRLSNLIASACAMLFSVSPGCT